MLETQRIQIEFVSVFDFTTYINVVIVVDSKVVFAHTNSSAKMFYSSENNLEGIFDTVSSACANSIANK